MKKTLALIGALLLLATSAVADSGIRYAALGYQQITSLSAAANLTVPTDTVPTTAVITAEVQAVRYRDDGVAPTATVGMTLAVGEKLIYTGPINNVQFIAQTSGAILNVLFYK